VSRPARIAFVLLLVSSIADLAFAQRRRPPKSKGASITWVNELPQNQQLPPRTTHHTFESHVAKQAVGYDSAPRSKWCMNARISSMSTGRSSIRNLNARTWPP
jgi:hypothetical protein